MRPTAFRKNGLFLGTALLGLGVAVPVYADSSAGALEEVIVTSQRRSENIQDVPIAVTAFTASALESSGIDGTQALQEGTPGLSMTRQIGSASPFIRGVGTANASAPGLEAPVALYVDGVYYPQNNGNIFSFNNIEVVEVLKGPQGTLFGRNSTGGLISITTRDPVSTPFIEGDVSYGKYNTVDTSFYATGGVDNLAADFALYGIHQGEGWGDNTTTNDEVNKQHALSMRTKLLFTPTDVDTFTVTLARSQDKSDLGLVVNAPRGSLYPDGTTNTGGDYDTRQDVNPSSDTVAVDVAVKFVHDADWATLSILTAYRDVKSDFRWDVDAIEISYLPADNNDWSRSLQEEIMLNGSTDSLEWTTGLFLYNADQGLDQTTGTSDHNPTALIPVANINTRAEVNTRSYAAFAQGTYALTDQTNFTAGYRYTIDKRDFDATSIGTLGHPLGAGTLVASTIQSETWKRPSWRVSIDHTFTQDFMAYVSYNRGFKSGVFNTANPYQDPVSPETLDAYEVGLKSQLFDNLLRLNVAAFRYKYEGIQLGQADDVGNNVLVNAAAATIDGAEFEAVLAPPVDFGTLQFSAGVSLLDAKYDSFPDGPINTPTGFGFNVPSFGDLSDNTMIHAPKSTFTLGATIAVPLNAGEIGASVNYFYNDGFYWEPDNRLEQPSYEVVNAKAYYAFGKDNNFRVHVFGKNLTDERYNSFVVSTGLGDIGSYDAPRTYGVGFGYKFE